MVRVRPSSAAWKELIAASLNGRGEARRPAIVAVAVVVDRSTLRRQPAAVEIFAVAADGDRLNVAVEETFWPGLYRHVRAFIPRQRPALCGPGISASVFLSKLKSGSWQVDCCSAVVQGS